MPKRRSVLELEQAINNSRFFTVSEEEMEAVHNTAKAKLLLDLWELSQYYWFETENGRPKTEYGEEIYRTSLRCMEEFDPEKGRFSDYFKNQVRYAVLDSKIEEWEVDKQEGIDPVFQESGTKSISTLFETKQFAQDNVEEMIEKQGALCQMSDYLEIIEKAFRKKQERTRPYLRTLWTHKCFDALVSIDIPGKHYTWIDYEFLEKYRNTESLPAQKEVAAMFGRCEQDASRAIRQFCELVAPRFLAASQK